MPEAIGEIPVIISGDWAQLQKDLLAAEVQARQSATRIADAINSASSAGTSTELVDIRTALAGIRSEADSVKGAQLDQTLLAVGTAAATLAAGIATAALALGNLVLEEGAAAEKTQNLADQLNLSFQDTRKLSEMAQIAGVSIESLSRVSMRLADALEDPAGAGKKVAQSLNEMGISAGNSGDALLQVLEKLAQIPDATERINKAHEIMGRTAIQLEPLLKNYGELSEAVTALGGQLDNDMVKRLLAADDAADKLSISWAHLKTEIAATFAPAVTAGLNVLTTLLSDPPSMKLDAQIADLRDEISSLTTELNRGTKSWGDFFAASTGAVGPSATAGMIELKKATLSMLEGQKQAIQRSKEYNAELDASNAVQRKAATSTKEHADAVARAARAHKEAKDALAAFSEQLRAQLSGTSAAIPSAKDLAAATLDIGTKATSAALAVGHERDAIEALNSIATSTRATLKDMVPSEMSTALENAKTETELLESAIKSLGDKSSVSLKKAQDNAIDYYLILKQRMDGLIITQHDVDEAWKKVLETQGIVTKETKANAASQRDSIVQVSETVRQLEQTWDSANRAISDGIADVILEGRSLADVFTSVAKQIARDLINIVVEGALKELKKALLENLDILGSIGKAIKGVFGGAASSAGGAAGSAGSAAGGAAGGVVSAVSGVVSAVSDVIANFQFYAMNKSLDIIVKHTLETVNELRNLRRDAWDQQTNLFLKLDDMWNEIRNVVSILGIMAQSGFGDGQNIAEQIADAIRPSGLGNASSVDRAKSFTELAQEMRNLDPGGFDQAFAEKYMEERSKINHGFDLTDEQETAASNAAILALAKTKELSLSVTETISNVTRSGSQASTALSDIQYEAASSTSSLASLSTAVGTAQVSISAIPPAMTRATNGIEQAVNDFRAGLLKANAARAEADAVMMKIVADAQFNPHIDTSGLSGSVGGQKFNLGSVGPDYSGFTDALVSLYRNGKISYDDLMAARNGALSSFTDYKRQQMPMFAGSQSALDVTGQTNQYRNSLQPVPVTVITPNPSADATADAIEKALIRRGIRVV